MQTFRRIACFVIDRQLNQDIYHMWKHCLTLLQGYVIEGGDNMK